MLHDPMWKSKPPITDASLENVAFLIGRLTYADMRELAQAVGQQLGEERQIDRIALALSGASEDILKRIPKQAPQVGLRNIAENPDV